MVFWCIFTIEFNYKPLKFNIMTTIRKTKIKNINGYEKSHILINDSIYCYQIGAEWRIEIVEEIPSVFADVSAKEIEAEVQFNDDYYIVDKFDNTCERVDSKPNFECKRFRFWIKGYSIEVFSIDEAAKEKTLRLASAASAVTGAMDKEDLERNYKTVHFSCDELSWQFRSDNKIIIK